MLRILGHAWASPLTLAGWLLAKVTGCRHVFAGSGARVYLASRWLRRVFFERFNVGAFAWGQTIIASDAWAAHVSFGHELVHVRQAMAWGPLLPIAYVLAGLVAMLRGGRWYADNHFERQAREKSGA